MKVLVTGASGLIGSALVRRCGRAAHEIVRLTRCGATRARRVSGGTRRRGRSIPPRSRESTRSCTSPASRSRAAGPTRKKRRIRDSRVLGTRLVRRGGRGARPAAAVLVCASAIGYYGDRGDEPRDRGGALRGRVPRRTWCGSGRRAADPARGRPASGSCTCASGSCRAARGGALRAQLPLFRLGLGGRVGSGRQYVSWVAIDDVVRAIEHALRERSLSGPVNVAAPDRSRTRSTRTRSAACCDRPQSCRRRRSR